MTTRAIVPARRRRWRRWLALAVVPLLLLAATAGVVRAFVIVGPSDAPTLRWGDLVLANTAAYDLRMPFTFHSLAEWRDPARGDMVLFRVPNKAGVIGFKRIVGVPGDRVEVRDGRLTINGRPMDYTPIPEFPRDDVAPRNQLGAVVLRETGMDMAQLVSITPAPGDSLHARRLSPGEYFVLGDNRDHSNDSRVFGAIPRGAVLGKLLLVLKRSEE